MVNEYRTCYLIDDMLNNDYEKTKNFFIKGNIKILFTTMTTCFEEKIKCDKLMIVSDEYFCRWTNRNQSYQAIHYNYMFKLIVQKQLESISNDYQVILLRYASDEFYFKNIFSLRSCLEKKLATHYFELISLSKRNIDTDEFIGMSLAPNNTQNFNVEILKYLITNNKSFNDLSNEYNSVPDLDQVLSHFNKLMRDNVCSEFILNNTKLLVVLKNLQKHNHVDTNKYKDLFKLTVESKKVEKSSSDLDIDDSDENNNKTFSSKPNR